MSEESLEFSNDASCEDQVFEDLVNDPPWHEDDLLDTSDFGKGAQNLRVVALNHQLRSVGRVPEDDVGRAASGSDRGFGALDNCGVSVLGVFEFDRGVKCDHVVLGSFYGLSAFGLDIDFLILDLVAFTGSGIHVVGVIRVYQGSNWVFEVLDIDVRVSEDIEDDVASKLGEGNAVGALWAGEYVKKEFSSRKILRLEDSSGVYIF